MSIGSVGSAGGSFDGSVPEARSAGAEAGAQTPTVQLSSTQLAGNRHVADVAAGTATIGFGTRSEGARAIQGALKTLGHLAGNADGIFGRQSEAALAAFQRQAGLDPTGRVDQRTLAALDGALQVGGRKTTGPAANDLVFLGMGDGARTEFRDLQRRTGVLGIADAPENDKVTVTIDRRNQTFDLTSDAGIASYVRALGVSGGRARELEAVIKGAGDDARDETALLVKAFLEAERGDRTIERLVLSGHSVGSGVWGDTNGMFELDTLEAVAKAFPKAASQLEDFMIAGCYSNSEAHVERFRKMFPNVKSVWAYGQSAPGTWTGAMVHNKLWEEATRGHDPGKVERSLAAGTRKGENVATWNIQDGYQADGATRPVATVRAELGAMRPRADAFFRGDQVVADTQYGPMRDYYRLIQEMLGNPGLPAAERPALEAQRDAAIRLIFWDARVKGLFQQNYAPKIDAGYRALGLEVPDFSKLSRKDGLAAVARFEHKLATTTPKPQAARDLLPLLTGGVRDLKESVIPNTWV